MRLKKLVLFLLIILFLGLLSYYYPFLTGNATNNIQQQIIYEKESAFVTRIIDGDTIVVSGKEIGDNTHIRLLGINTPEKKTSYANDATNFLKENIENKSIEILRDKEDSDKYKRKLRYVFYNARLLNVEILENGLATSFMTWGLVYETKLKNAEKFAKNNEIGLWEKSKDRCLVCIKLVKLESIEDYFIIKNNCDFYCDLSGWFVKDDANHFFYLFGIDSGESMKYDSKNKFKTKIWNDNGDRFFMRDKEGKMVLFWEYSNYKK